MDASGKLVRDRIPEIIEASGRTATTRLLGPAERLPALMAKLQEEADELRAADTAAHQTEEIADVLEVLLAVAAELGVPWAQVESVANAKRTQRGGFRRGIWMATA